MFITITMALMRYTSGSRSPLFPFGQRERADMQQDCYSQPSSERLRKFADVCEQVSDVTYSTDSDPEGNEDLQLERCDTVRRSEIADTTEHEIVPVSPRSPSIVVNSPAGGTIRGLDEQGNEIFDEAGFDSSTKLDEMEKENQSIFYDGALSPLTAIDNTKKSFAGDVKYELQSETQVCYQYLGDGTILVKYTSFLLMRSERETGSPASKKRYDVLVKNCDFDIDRAYEIDFGQECVDLGAHDWQPQCRNGQIRSVTFLAPHHRETINIELKLAVFYDSQDLLDVHVPAFASPLGAIGYERIEVEQGAMPSHFEPVKVSSGGGSRFDWTVKRATRHFICSRYLRPGLTSKSFPTADDVILTFEKLPRVPFQYLEASPSAEIPIHCVTFKIIPGSLHHVYCQEKIVIDSNCLTELRVDPAGWLPVSSLVERASAKETYDHWRLDQRNPFDAQNGTYIFAGPLLTEEFHVLTIRICWSYPLDPAESQTQPAQLTLPRILGRKVCFVRVSCLLSDAFVALRDTPIDIECPPPSTYCLRFLAPEQALAIIFPKGFDNRVSPITWIQAAAASQGWNSKDIDEEAEDDSPIIPPVADSWQEGVPDDIGDLDEVLKPRRQDRRFWIQLLSILAALVVLAAIMPVFNMRTSPGAHALMHVNATTENKTDGMDLNYRPDFDTQRPEGKSINVSRRGTVTALLRGWREPLKRVDLVLLDLLEKRLGQIDESDENPNSRLWISHCDWVCLRDRFDTYMAWAWLAR